MNTETETTYIIDGRVPMLHLHAREPNFLASSYSPASLWILAYIKDRDGKLKCHQDGTEGLISCSTKV